MQLSTNYQNSHIQFEHCQTLHSILDPFQQFAHFCAKSAFWNFCDILELFSTFNKVHFSQLLINWSKCVKYLTNYMKSSIWTNVVHFTLAIGYFCTLTIYKIDSQSSSCFFDFCTFLDTKLVELLEFDHYFRQSIEGFLLKVQFTTLLHFASSLHTFVTQSGALLYFSHEINDQLCAKSTYMNYYRSL